MRRTARLWTRPRMSQVRAPFTPGTDEYRRWRNVLHINGGLCNILNHLDEKEDKDPSLRGKLDDIRNEVRRLRDRLDYYDGQGHTEIGQPVEMVPTPTFDMDEYSGISSSSEDEKKIDRTLAQLDGEQLFGPSQPANQSRNDSSSSYYYEYEEEEEKKEKKRPRTRAEKKHRVMFFDPNPDYTEVPPLVMWRWSYSSDGEEGRWEGPRDIKWEPPKEGPK